MDLDPAVGGEIGKKRPAVIVSNDAGNARMNRVQVVPITSNTKRVFSSEALVALPDGVKKAMADQVQTASKLRLRRYIAHLTAAEMQAIERALRVQLSL